MRKALIVGTCLTAVLVLLSVGVAHAGGGPNGTVLTWRDEADSGWFMTTGSGIVHQWRYNHPLFGDVHYVYKPYSQFPYAVQEGCETDEGTVLRIWDSWSYDSFRPNFDNPALADTIYAPGEVYFVCAYEWTE
jgi:hypothetical protein